MAWDPSKRSERVQERARSTPFPDLYYDCMDDRFGRTVPPIEEWEKVLTGKRLLGEPDPPDDKVCGIFIHERVTLIVCQLDDEEIRLTITIQN